MTANNTDESARQLYPTIEPFNAGHLRVSDIHEIYFEECGNPDADLNDDGIINQLDLGILLAEFNVCGTPG